MTLVGIAERCETATEADRELDCAIAKALGWTDVWNRHDMADGFAPDAVCEAAIPRFTGSLDVALTLAPEGLRWLFMETRFSTYHAEVGWPHAGNAATPALALCAAALRALAAATGTAKTPQAVECEASQSGPKGNAHKSVSPRRPG